jgi:predicted acetyltransferase
MTIEIRRLDLEEAINIAHFLSPYAFTPTPPLPEFEQFAEKLNSREGANYYAVFVDNEPLVISCETTPFSQNLRGSLFKMAGVAGVASHPAARRSGYVRKLMHYMYQEFEKNGYAVSCLYPFKESFYQRLGYVTLPQPKKMSFNASNLQPVLNLDIEGSYDLVSYEEGYDAYRTYCEKLQIQVHGMAVFTIPQKKAAKFHQSWLVFTKQHNEIIGVMNYRLEDKILNQTMIANEFLFSNAQGKFLLLNWIARHIDQVGKVVLSIRPDQFGENFFTDIRTEYEIVFRAPMARVIDISALDGLSVGKGKITVRVNDPDCEWNNGVWTFESKAGHLNLIKSEHPDCELTIHGVTALAYGVYDPEEFELRGWGNPDREQQEVLRMMFPPAIPYVHAIF